MGTISVAVGEGGPKALHRRSGKKAIARDGQDIGWGLCAREAGNFTLVVIIFLFLRLTTDGGYYAVPAYAALLLSCSDLLASS